MDQVIPILTEVRELLSSRQNDFAWSAWRNRETALAEMDEVIRRARAGSLSELSVLFAPSGPIQDVSASTGWGDRFLELAERLDREVAKRT